ncbi:hypothetical protein HK405_014748, partial [Cladochytrium tenue]
LTPAYLAARLTTLNARLATLPVGDPRPVARLALLLVVVAAVVALVALSAARRTEPQPLTFEPAVAAAAVFLALGVAVTARDKVGRALAEAAAEWSACDTVAGGIVWTAETGTHADPMSCGCELAVSPVRRPWRLLARRAPTSPPAELSVVVDPLPAYELSAADAAVGGSAALDVETGNEFQGPPPPKWRPARR